MNLNSPDMLALKNSRHGEIGKAAADQVRSEVIPALTAAFGEAVKELPTPHDIPQIEVTAEKIHPVLASLKESGFNMLLDLTAADYLPREPRFEVVYHLLGVPSMQRLRLRVPLQEEKAKVPTASDLWQSAGPAEREVWDLFGITFTGHPNLTRILNPDDWEGHPLRRDYPVTGPRALEGDAAPAERNRFHPIKFVEDLKDKG